MAGKPISLDELRRLHGQGARVEFDTRRVTVAELPALIEQMQALVEASQSGEAEPADLTGPMESLTQAVRELKIEARVDAPDLTPLYEAIEGLHQRIGALLERRPPRYTFTVERDNRGRISAINAEPES